MERDWVLPVEMGEGENGTALLVAGAGGNGDEAPLLEAARKRCSLCWREWVERIRARESVLAEEKFKELNRGQCVEPAEWEPVAGGKWRRRPECSGAGGWEWM